MEPWTGLVRVTPLPGNERQKGAVSRARETAPILECRAGKPYGTIGIYRRVRPRKRKTAPEEQTDRLDFERRFKKIPPSRYSPTQEMCSTIAEAGLNFRVRNGNGCGPRSMDGGKTLSLFPVP